MTAQTRQYDLVLLGATGYTGKLTAQYIQEHVATDLKWAIAGRNAGKLAGVTEDLKQLNPDRLQPAIETAALEKNDLDALAQKTKVLISTVGPYHKYGSPVVQACATNGTHYLDITGEVPWVYDMHQKWHETAKENGVVIISQCGVDSVPADLLAYSLASLVREKLHVGITECVLALEELSGGISGGTANTAITLVESYSSSQLLTAMNPYSLSTVPPPNKRPGGGIVAAMLGARSVEGLGVLTDSPQGALDTVIVNRSWSLFDGGNFYGKNFYYTEWMRVRNTLIGSLVHYGLAALMLSLWVPPVRWLLKRMVYEPGQGPTKEEFQNDRLAYKAIAKVEGESSKQAVATFSYNGGGYYLTGILVAEAAMTLLRGGDTLASKLGGMVTPATLEKGYVDRLQKAGVKLDVRLVEKSSAA